MRAAAEERLMLMERIEHLARIGFCPIRQFPRAQKEIRVVKPRLRSWNAAGSRG